MPDIAELLSYIPTVQQIVFGGIATLVAVAALFTVLAPNLFHSALGLVATLFGIAGVYVMLEAEFLAVSQILVYVGAISTLITFAIMLTRGMMYGRTAATNRQMLASILVTSLFFFATLGVVNNVEWPMVGAPIGDGEALIAKLGELFVTVYILPFIMMALLLLVALAGAILLARDDQP